MKRMARIFIFYLCFFSIAWGKELPSLIGTWQTIDDLSGQPKAMIKIEESRDHTFSGRIIKIFSQDQAQLCKFCEGNKKNKPLLGLIIMDHLKKSKENSHAWTGGKILDPQNGKTYQCHVLLLENGKRLTVRGYIGVPLFGRSQTWIRYST
jgi:uncharacterized protein (DUF2147 family)